MARPNEGRQPTTGTKEAVVLNDDRSWRLRHWKVQAGWILMLGVGACTDSTAPVPPPAPNAAEVQVQMHAVELPDFSDLTDRLLPALDDPAQAAALQRTIDEYALALKKEDVVGVNGALTRMRRTVSATAFHPTTMSLVMRAIDAADAAVQPLK